MSDFLTREIIRKIFANIGCVPAKLGLAGLSLPEFKIKNCVNGKYEDGTEFSYAIFAAKIKIDVCDLHCAFVDLSDGNTTEFAAVFQMGNNPCYGIRLIYNEEDCGLFMYHDGVIWKSTTAFWQAKILSAFENIVDHGFSWEVEDEFIFNNKLISLTEI